PLGRGKPGGALSQLHPVELLAQLLTGLVERNGVDPALIDDVMIGNVTQAGEQGGTPARQAVLAAGFPTHVPGVTIERKCGSGQQAIEFAVQSVAAGVNDLVIAGGVESMSRVPMGSNRMGADVYGPSITERFGELVGQGVAAELVAHKWGLSREQLDTYALASNERAAYAQAQGWFDAELYPIDTPTGPVKRDESIRASTSMARLAGLAPVFGSPAVRQRFPELEPKVTAGSSSQITDGAAVLLIASEKCAAALGLHPRAAVYASAVVGDDPLLMLTAPIPATRKVLSRAGLKVQDIGVFEVNEAFAPVPLAWQAELGVPSEVLNPVGGAIALGHPLGASGARIMTTMLHHMERNGIRFGLQTMCEAGGMANATIIERLDPSA
ncbi:thiolase family protein, partial [Mycobacterium sp.]|uniref:thiolase family protein n=1 Tax=Mycobacterium sp. TaxID=1785 RepID=UPI003BB13E22